MKDVLSVALPVSLPARFWSDVDRIALCVHRPSGSSPDFRRIVDRLEIPAGSFVVSAARFIAAGVVTLEQLQLLGRYESRSIVTANVERHVELGFFNELDRGRYTPTEEFRTASLVVLDVQARAAERLWAGTADLAELAASAGSVVSTAAPSVPAPAFSAQRADHHVTPTSPAGQLLAFVTELRYLRSDLHAHALAAYGFYGPTARAVDRAWKGHEMTADDLRRLKDKHLAVDGVSGWQLSDAARRARDEAEAVTEVLSGFALEATPEGARTSLSMALAHLPGDDPRPIADR
jgi:hypothetical protein